MCGLCGVLSTTVSDFEFEKFIQLFNVSSLRGEHSSGLFSVKEIEAKASTGADIRFRGNPERSNTSSTTGGSVKKSN